MLRRVSLVRTDISEECIASIIRVTRIGDDGGDMFLRNFGLYGSHKALTSQRTAFIDSLLVSSAVEWACFGIVYTTG
jgi:hypothetical protein